MVCLDMIRSEKRQFLTFSSLDPSGQAKMLWKGGLSDFCHVPSTFCG